MFPFIYVMVFFEYLCVSPLHATVYYVCEKNILHHGHINDVLKSIAVNLFHKVNCFFVSICDLFLKKK